MKAAHLARRALECVLRGEPLCTLTEDQGRPLNTAVRDLKALRAITRDGTRHYTPGPNAQRVLAALTTLTEAP